MSCAMLAESSPSEAIFSWWIRDICSFFSSVTTRSTSSTYCAPPGICSG